jgi:hypothetical protein
MPVLFHGTTRAFAVALATVPGTINVQAGGGEFGMGFYAQSSVSNAMRWASGRSPTQAAVLQLQIDDIAYHALHRITLSRPQAVALTRRLRNQGRERTWTRNCDILIGPLNGNVRIEQQKFESPGSEALLNGANTTRMVLP